MAGNSKKRRHEHDNDDPPTLRQRTAAPSSPDIPPQNAEASDLTQQLLDISTSTVADDPGAFVPDPSIENKLTRAINTILHDTKSNIFITGPAGSGKSYLTKGLVKALRDGGRKVAIAAPTGTAAMNISGKTIHKLCNLTPSSIKRGILPMLEAAREGSLQRRLSSIRVLVIDEISMVSNEMFELVSRMFQEAHGNANRPFGTTQVVAIGDFLQLPPVSGQAYCLECGEERRKVGQKLKCPQHGTVSSQEKWAFCSPHWARSRFRCIVLGQIMRQADDPAYAQVILDLWADKALSLQQIHTLRATRAVQEPAIRLFSKRDLVDRFNKMQWEKLDTPPRSYICHDGYNQHSSHKSQPWISRMLTTRLPPNQSLLCMRGSRYLEELYLRVGMPVILLHNLCVDQGLVNGSVGKIIAFEYHNPRSSRVSANTLLDDSGYAYEDEEGILLDGFCPSLGGNHSEMAFEGIARFYQKNDSYLPVVEFYNGQIRTITPQCDSEETIHADHLSKGWRIQIPLVAGWASTIHRSQGMTLDRVVVDVRDCFESGMQYVALSRARTLAGMRVRGLEADSIQPQPSEVKSFMDQVKANARAWI